MTQATVNAGNSAVRNLNPNAQQFSSGDFTNGTVLGGSTIPSDDSYSDYPESGLGPYQLRQHQSQLYSDIDQSPFYGEVDPSSLANLQHHHPQSDPNFGLNDPSAMLDRLDHPQGPILNPNHLQQAFYSAMPDDEQAQPAEVTGEQRRQMIRKQLDYYFSEKNMMHDEFLMSQMDHEDYVSISTIANFKMMRRLTSDLQLIVDVLKELPTVEVDAEEKNVRSTIVKTNRLAGKRCIIILRDVPLDANESEISDLFATEHCPVRAVACERVLGSGKSDCWYVTFNSEDEAQNAFLYLTRENVSIRGQKVLARMKARLRQIPASVPSTNASTPVSPPLQATTNNGGATSPPPAPLQQQQQQQQAQTQQLQQQQQQQQPVPSYSNSNFVPQPPPPPNASIGQYPSQLQQQQYNPSQVHPSVYMQATANQSSILGNLQASNGNYRQPMHSSMGPPHVTGPYPSGNPSQHPVTMEHASQLQQFRMTYPNYPTNMSFDRASWAPATAAHQQSVQNVQPTLSFANAPQQGNMASYPSTMHQQAQFLAANSSLFQPGLFPGGFVYMQTQPYSTNEPYSTMPYNGGNKSKTRMTREYPPSSKPRNPSRPLGARNSRQEGYQMTSDHPNELPDYHQHSTPHSEGSSSPVSRIEATMNRPHDAIAPVVSNPSLQHVQAYPLAALDPSTSETIEHFQTPSTDNLLYPNKTNSHPIPSQAAVEPNALQEQIHEPSNLGKYPNATSASVDTSKSSPMNYQPLEQRKAHSNVQEAPHNASSINENQHPSNKKVTRPPTNEQQQGQVSIPPLMSRDNRSNQNASRPSSSSQQGARPAPQQQPRSNPNNNHPNPSTPLSVAIPKVPSVTYYNQTSSPQSPSSNQKNPQQQQQQQQQQQLIDNSGPRSYADMLKLKQAPQKQTDSNKSTTSPPNELNDLSSSRAQSPAINTKVESVSTSGIASSETNGPSSSSSSDLSPTNPPDLSSSINNDSNLARRNSSASDHPQQQAQQHGSSPSHQQYNNSRGRGRGGGGGGNYRYSNDRRPGSNSSLNRGGGGRGRRPVNNNAGANGPPPYQSRGSGGRGNGRFFDRPRGSGNYHNSNQSVQRFTGNTGNVEPQVHYTE